MSKKTKLALQNGIIFIEDVQGGSPPDPVTDEAVQNTSTCISVACLHEADGEAELILGPADEVMPSYALAFDGIIETPSRELVISTVLNEHVLKTMVLELNTRIRVWRSHPQWPKQVTVGWG